MFYSWKEYDPVNREGGRNGPGVPGFHIPVMVSLVMMIFLVWSISLRWVWGRTEILSFMGDLGGFKGLFR